MTCVISRPAHDFDLSLSLSLSLFAAAPFNITWWCSLRRRRRRRTCIDSIKRGESIEECIVGGPFVSSWDRGPDNASCSVRSKQAPSILLRLFQAGRVIT